MSTLRTANIQSLSTSTPPIIRDSAGTEVGTFCRSWVNFNGTGTVAIRASFNVSSITDNGVGDYTVNFTNALSDANYVVCLSASSSAAGGTDVNQITGDVSVPRTSSSVKVQYLISSGSAFIDVPHFNVAIFR